MNTYIQSETSTLMYSDHCANPPQLYSLEPFYPTLETNNLCKYRFDSSAKGSSILPLNKQPFYSVNSLLITQMLLGLVCTTIAKAIIHISRGESNIYGTEIEVRDGFGPAGWSKKKLGSLRSNFYHNLAGNSFSCMQCQ